MIKLKINNKPARYHKDGYPQIRISHRKRTGKRDPRYLLECGDCPEKLEIYYDNDGESLEINGVIGSTENWREILIPLLKNKTSQK